VWTAIEPQSKLLSVQVGERTLAMAHAILHQITQLVAPGCVPLFVSDSYPNYLLAIVSHFGQWVQPPRRQDKGPAPKPRWMPLPELLDAQVVKTMRRRRSVEVKHRVVCRFRPFRPRERGPKRLSVMARYTTPCSVPSKTTR
jgi:hypothetical protein